MKSDTPLTDKVVLSSLQSGRQLVPYEFARALERELFKAVNESFPLDAPFPFVKPVHISGIFPLDLRDNNNMLICQFTRQDPAMAIRDLINGAK